MGLRSQFAQNLRYGLTKRGMQSQAPQVNITDTFNGMLRKMTSAPPTASTGVSPIPQMGKPAVGVAAAVNAIPVATLAESQVGSLVGGGDEVGGAGNFFKAHWGKIIIVTLVLVVITIFIVRTALVAKAKKKSTLGEEKKEEDVQWERYFDENDENTKPSHPAQPALPQVPRHQPMQPAQHHQPQQHAQHHQPPVHHQPQQHAQHHQPPPPVNHAPQRQQQPTPAHSSRQHQPIMPSADATHGHTQSQGMMPQATRPIREEGSSTMPVSDVPITSQKSVEPPKATAGNSGAAQEGSKTPQIPSGDGEGAGYTALD